MGFLNWFADKKEESHKETKISLKEIEDFISKKLKEDFEPLKEPIKEEYENLQTVANDMRDHLKVLEEATYPERTYQIIANKAIGNRKSFIYNMNFLIEQLKKPIGDDVINVLNFFDEADKIINDTNLETTKEYVILKILFEKEGKEVVKSFRQIVEINDKIENMLKKPREFNQKIPKIKNAVSEILRLAEELKENDAGELDKKLRENENKVKEIENELEKLHYSNDWKAFLEMNRTREELKLRMENKRFDLINKISKLEVPLKKYKWSFEKGILNMYIEKSFESILHEDPKGEAFMSAIKDMKEKITEGKMDLKDIKKFMPIIEDMIENNTVGNIIEEYLNLSEELKNQNENISSQEVSKRKIRLENEMNILKREIEKLKDYRKESTNRVQRMEESKKHKIKELEDLLYDPFGKRILLEVN